MINNTEEKQKISYFQLVRSNGNFRWLWIAEIVSLLGDWFNLIATATLLTNLTDSGTAVGGLFVVRMLAPFLIAPLAGVIADRYDRRLILIISDIARAVIVLGFLFVRSPSDIWILYVLTGIQLAVSGFFYPAQNSLIPSIVKSHEIGTANALTSITWSVMYAFGMALGGMFAGKWGVYPSYIVDSLSFVLSAVCVYFISYSASINERIESGSIFDAVTQHIDGLKYLKINPEVFFVAIAKGLIYLVALGGIPVVWIEISKNIYVIGEGGSTSMGIIFALWGTGTGIGPVVARFFTGDANNRLKYAVGLAYPIVAIGVLIMAMQFSFAVLLAGVFTLGLGVGVIWVFTTQLLMQLVPSAMRGRVFATEFAFFTLFYAVSAASVGYIMDTTSLGTSGVMSWMSLAVLVPGVFWWWSVRRFK